MSTTISTSCGSIAGDPLFPCGKDFSMRCRIGSIRVGLLCAVGWTGLSEFISVGARVHLRAIKIYKNYSRKL